MTTGITAGAIAAAEEAVRDAEAAEREARQQAQANSGRAGQAVQRIRALGLELQQAMDAETVRELRDQVQKLEKDRIAISSLQPGLDTALERASDATRRAKSLVTARIVQVDLLQRELTRAEQQFRQKRGELEIAERNITQLRTRLAALEATS